jgi:hypothetical protein
MAGVERATASVEAPIESFTKLLLLNIVQTPLAARKCRRIGRSAGKLQPPICSPEHEQPDFDFEFKFFSLKFFKLKFSIKNKILCKLETANERKANPEKTIISPEAANKYGLISIFIS